MVNGVAVAGRRCRGRGGGRQRGRDADLVGQDVDLVLRLDVDVDDAADAQVDGGRDVEDAAARRGEELDAQVGDDLGGCGRHFVFLSFVSVASSRMGGLGSLV